MDSRDPLGGSGVPGASQNQDRGTQEAGTAGQFMQPPPPRAAAGNPPSLSTAGLSVGLNPIGSHSTSPTGYFGLVNTPSTIATTPLLSHSPPLPASASASATAAEMSYASSGQFVPLAQPNNYHKPIDDSLSPEPSDPGTLDGQRNPHRRGYQACQRCRERKVKCDLGSVDAPTSPPCKRCKRERLECHFAPTRKKQKRSDGTAKDVSHDQTLRPAHEAISPITAKASNANSPRIANTAASRLGWPARETRPTITSQPRDEYLSTGTSSLANKHSSVHLHSQVAAATLNAPMSSTQDNIMLLVDAANAFSENATPIEKDSPHSERPGRKRTHSNINHIGPDAPNDVGITPEEQAEQQAGINAWADMRFVKNGWFTAWEAMDYVEYFYDKLAPMTPVVFPDYRSPFKHRELLIDEPILALAILAIASRHMQLSGHAAVSRAYLIHDKLWNNLRRQVERLLWGQEQFGGGFSGGGNASSLRESQSGQLTWTGSLRTLGTIEALLVLTDWQPRALHFPPGDGETGLLDASLVPYADNKPREPRAGRDYEHLPYASWLEPAWRSDRMSWMLLGLGQNLAFELGVFDTNHYNCRHQHGPDSECARKRRIRLLLLVYVAQTGGRMGVQSSLHVEQWESDTIWDQTSRPENIAPGEYSVDLMQSCWLDIARLMNRANRDVFSSAQFTRALTSSGNYKGAIKQFEPLLSHWKNVFEKAKAYIHPVMRHILTMEYHYSRLYLNSLGLQKVVETWVESGSNQGKATLAKVIEENRVYIGEVTDAALAILREVTEGIGPKGYLRDAPVRTFLRSLSAMMFVLKRFSLGTHEKMVRECLDQLEKITTEMSKQVVDDVHLSASTSRLVTNIVKNVKQTLIRVHLPGTGSAGPSRDQSRPQSPQANGHDATESGQSAPIPASTLAQQLSPEWNLRDPLAGIEAKPMAELESQMFVPPPNMVVDGDILDHALPVDSNLDPSMTDFSDWFALPLDNLWHNSDATVDNGFGGIGPTVGRQDMLEVLTNQDYSQMQWNGGFPQGLQ